MDGKTGRNTGSTDSPGFSPEQAQVLRELADRLLRGQQARQTEYELYGQETTTLSIRLTKRMAEDIRAASTGRGLSVSELIRELIDAYLLGQGEQ